MVNKETIAEAISDARRDLQNHFLTNTYLI